jgi:hypothetical protein
MNIRAPTGPALALPSYRDVLHEPFIAQAFCRLASVDQFCLSGRLTVSYWLSTSPPRVWASQSATAYPLRQIGNDISDGE